MDPHWLLNNTHQSNNDVVFRLKSCFIFLSFSGPNYFNCNIWSTKYLILNISTNRFEWNSFLELIYTKIIHFLDYFFPQHNLPGNLLLIYFKVRFSLKNFEFILDWEDIYFKRSLPFCCMEGRIDAELFWWAFNFKNRLADLFKYHFKFIILLYQERSKQLWPSFFNLMRGEVKLSLRSFSSLLSFPSRIKS